MSRIRLIVLITIMFTMLAACATSQTAGQPSPLPTTHTSQSGITPQSTPTAQVSSSRSDLPEAALPAFTFLVEEMGFPADQVTLETSQEVQWRDSCLGIFVKNMPCLDVITPGYILVFDTPQGEFIFHTDQSGAKYILVQPSIAPGADFSTGSGIEGQVFLGPTCPGPVSDDPTQATQCADQPYQATITILDDNGETVMQFQTDAQGRFRVILASETYTLHPESPDVRPWAPEQTITVVSQEFTQVIITYDTGIR